jgi:hypothetical protein
MRGWFEETLGDEVATALEFYNSAIEILKWGAERWRDVPFEDKGAVFQPTFIRGIKCLRLDLLLKVCHKLPVRNVGTNSGYYNATRVAIKTPASSLTRS